MKLKKGDRQGIRSEFKTMDIQQALNAAYNPTNGYPVFGGFRPYPSPVQQQAVTPEPEKEKEEKKEKKEEPKRSAPKKVPQINVGFSGPAIDTPIFHATANVFGLEPTKLGAVDRNQLQGIIELVAEKLGTLDEQKILNFIRRESHGLSGENRFREMYRTLVFIKSPEKKKSPWGK